MLFVFPKLSVRIYTLIVTFCMHLKVFSSHVFTAHVCMICVLFFVVMSILILKKYFDVLRVTS